MVIGNWNFAVTNCERVTCRPGWWLYPHGIKSYLFCSLAGISFTATVSKRLSFSLTFYCSCLIARHQEMKDQTMPFNDIVTSTSNEDNSAQTTRKASEQLQNSQSLANTDIELLESPAERRLRPKPNSLITKQCSSSSAAYTASQSNCLFSLPSIQ